MGLDVRKPVFGDLRTSAKLISVLVIALWNVSYLNFLQAIFQLISVVGRKVWV